MLKRIARYSCQKVLDYYGRRDAGRLAGFFKELSDYTVFLKSNLPDLGPAYDKYVREISTEDMAISLETSQFLYALAKLTEAKRILDLGSGFSSYVLRLYSMTAQNDVTIYSVDDDETWLQKTRTFLNAFELPQQHAMEWSVFQKQPLSGFDLILHDLGSIDLRIESLPFAISLLNTSGILVLDDMHKARGGLIGGYRAVAVRKVRQAGLLRLSARQFTLDKYGRFSEIAFRAST
jgi:predicted O-methyltransferase YrrM